MEEKSTGKIFAAKHIKTRKKEQKQEALEEVKLLKKLSDPHIIHLVTAYEKRAEIIVVLEYLDGGELFEKVADELVIRYSSDIACSAESSEWQSKANRKIVKKLDQDQSHFTKQ